MSKSNNSDLLLLASAPLVTIFIASIGLDPINLPKSLLLAFFGFAALPTIFFKGNLNKIPKIALYPILLFGFSLLPPLFFSDSPLSQQFYGTYGRNFGLMSFLSLMFLFLAASKSSSYEFNRKIILGLVVSGVINAIVSILEIFNITLVNYSSNTNPIMGTFGNPNFLSAFLAMCSSVVFVFLLAKKKDSRFVVASSICLAVFLYLIIFSQSRQGLVTFFATVLMIFQIWLYKTQRSRIIQWSVGLCSLFFGCILILGILNQGPLASLLYKTSVSIRGVYWRAGIEMFKAHPMTGIGLNSYGDYYRQYREKNALIFPGESTISNASHNVFIDYAVTGGVLHLAFYITILFASGYSLVALVKKSKGFDPIIMGVGAGWLSYQIQSLVSIDQRGLAVWGWIFSGLLIGMNATNATSPKLERRDKSKLHKGAIVLAGISGVIISLPPFLADVAWKKALTNPSAVAVSAAARKWPLDEDRMFQAANIFYQNKMYQESLQIGQELIKFKPRSSFGWDIINNSPVSTSSQKQEAVVRMKKLDPWNTNLK